MGEDFDWKCCGCGIPTPGKRRACVCPTGVVYRSVNGKWEDAWSLGGVVQVRESEDGIRGYVRVECLPYVMDDGVRREGVCDIPVWRAPAKEAGPVKRWGWDGDTAAPTITPSYHCQKCGLHITITKGLEQGRPVPADT